jgi:predicted Zn-dependent protease
MNEVTATPSEASAGAPGGPPASDSRPRGSALGRLLSSGGLALVRPARALWRYGSRHPLGLLGVVLLLAVTAFGLLVGGSQLWAAYHLRAARDCLERYHTAEAPAHLQACLLVRPRDPEVLLLAARAARRIGAFDRAEDILNRYESVHGVDDPLILERMLLRAERGEIEPVIRLFKARIEQQHPDAPLMLEALAQAYLRAYRLGDAEDTLKRWLALQPNNVQALLLQGTLCELRQQRGEAASYYRKAVEMDPLLDDARFRLTGSLVELGRGGEALPHLEYLRKRLPDHPDVELRLARSKELVGQPAEAVQVLDDLLKRQPENAAALGERGRLALEAGQLEQAEALLRKAVEIDPGAYPTRYQFYKCLTRRGKAVEAKEEADRLKTLEDDMRTFIEITTQRLQRAPNDPALQHQLAQILLRGGQVEDAVRWLHSALRIDPNYAPAHQMLAAYYLRIGNQALAAFHRSRARSAAAEESPPHPQPLSPEGRGEKGGKPLPPERSGEKGGKSLSPEGGGGKSKP